MHSEPFDYRSARDVMKDNENISLMLGLPITKGSFSGESEHPRYESRRKTYSLDSLQEGRSRRITAHRGTKPISYFGDGHLMTIAPTGAGKGRSVIIPNLLNYLGPVVVIDPKGENYAVTARRRKDMGQEVFCLDPFSVLGDNSDGLNPLDIFNLDGSDVETDAQMLAELLSTGKRSHEEAFWDISSCALYSGLIAHVATGMAIEERNLNTVRKMVVNDDTVLNIAKLLDDSGKTMSRMAYDEMAAFLQMPEDRTRPSVLAVANSYIKAFLSERVARTLEKSSFSLSDVVSGKPLSIYLVIPPNKLRSHKALLLLWIGTLLQSITSRKNIPEQRTLFLLDECAQLGNFHFLETVITLCRGYGLQAWSFWQDIGQIKQLYPSGWTTMINNCSVLQVFGAKNYMVASEFASMVGVETDAIRDIQSNEQILIINGSNPIRANRYDYLNNPQFKGLFDQNPLYANHFGSNQKNQSSSKWLKSS
jgi:type IV secretion system protein VirD4